MTATIVSAAGEPGAARDARDGSSPVYVFVIGREVDVRLVFAPLRRRRQRQARARATRLPASRSMRTSLFARRSRRCPLTAL